MKATCAAPERTAFTLIELLVVVAIISVLAGLLLSVLSNAKKRVRSLSCKNHLHQVGLALQMYLPDNNNIYPPAMGDRKTWADRLAPYNPVNWTNVAWHCPEYVADGGIIEWEPPPPEGGTLKISTSYAYNTAGMVGIQWAGNFGSRKGPPLGLSGLNLMVPENRIVAPSEMYVVGDTRPVYFERGARGFHGEVLMRPWLLMPSRLNAAYTESNPPHQEAYNLLFADGHVSPVKRKDYLYPPRTAQNWNRDHLPHPEMWPATTEWAVKN